MLGWRSSSVSSLRQLQSGRVMIGIAGTPNRALTTSGALQIAEIAHRGVARAGNGKAPRTMRRCRNCLTHIRRKCRCAAAAPASSRYASCARRQARRLPFVLSFGARPECARAYSQCCKFAAAQAIMPNSRAARKPRRFREQVQSQRRSGPGCNTERMTSQYLSFAAVAPKALARTAALRP